VHAIQEPMLFEDYRPFPFISPNSFYQVTLRDGCWCVISRLDQRTQSICGNVNEAYQLAESLNATGRRIPLR
jgi:hypothetical protein